jgi:hypothetical protein
MPIFYCEYLRIFELLESQICDYHFPTLYIFIKHGSLARSPRIILIYSKWLLSFLWVCRGGVLAQTKRVKTTIAYKPLDDMHVLCRMVARQSSDLKIIAFPLVSLLMVSLHKP